MGPGGGRRHAGLRRHARRRRRGLRRLGRGRAGGLGGPRRPGVLRRRGPPPRPRQPGVRASASTTTPAVAIQALLDAGAERVAYIDIDVHHGDGTQWIFFEEPRVLTCSVHETGRYLFPGTGGMAERGIGAAEGTSVNVPLPPFSGDRPYLRAIEEVIAPAVRGVRARRDRHPGRRRPAPRRPAGPPAGHDAGLPAGLPLPAPARARGGRRALGGARGRRLHLRGRAARLDAPVRGDARRRARRRDPRELVARGRGAGRAARCRAACRTTPSPRCPPRSGRGPTWRATASSTTPARSSSASRPAPGGAGRRRDGGRARLARAPGRRPRGAARPRRLARPARRALGGGGPERRRQDDAARRWPARPCSRARGRRACSGKALGATDVRALRAGIGAVDARVAAAFRPRMTALEAVMTGAAASIVPLADGRGGGAPAGRGAARPDGLRRPGGAPGRDPVARRAAARAAGAGADAAPAPAAARRADRRASTCRAARRSSTGSTRSPARHPELAVVQVSHHLEELAGSTTHAPAAARGAGRRRRARRAGAARGAALALLRRAGAPGARRRPACSP